MRSVGCLLKSVVVRSRQDARGSVSERRMRSNEQYLRVRPKREVSFSFVARQKKGGQEAVLGGHLAFFASAFPLLRTLHQHRDEVSGKRDKLQVYEEDSSDRCSLSVARERKRRSECPTC